MTDMFTKEKRSEIMSKIRGKNTGPELILKSLLDGRIFRYQPKVYGNPDFASKKHKIAVFIDGCFWHGCPKCNRTPDRNAEYWHAKIHRNKLRDKKITKKLKARGWKVLRFWEHDVNKNPEEVHGKIIKGLIECRGNLK